MDQTAELPAEQVYRRPLQGLPSDEFTSPVLAMQGRLAKEVFAEIFQGTANPRLYRADGMPDLNRNFSLRISSK